MILRSSGAWLIPSLVALIMTTANAQPGTGIEKNQSPVSFVDPFIGTGGLGHVFPGACVPFGMVQVGPDTDTEGWEHCSGYHAGDRSIMGFSHTHLSGTGAPDMGDVLIMPFIGEPHFSAGSKDGTQKGYRSGFSQATEKARPGYYAVKLDDYDIYAEMTASARAGFHRYTFPASDQAGIIIDLAHGIGDTAITGSFRIIDDHTIAGYRHSKGFIKDHYYYFYASFSKPFEKISSFADGQTGDKRSFSAQDAKLVLHFKTAPGEKILVKLGLSTTGEHGAMNNLKKEMPDWDFSKTEKQASATWKNYLSKIEITTDDISQKTIFYTALYHCLVCPNLISDADGAYRGWDGQNHRSSSMYYTNFSLWDTYRALHPLFSLLYPDDNTAFINSMLQKYKETGQLPFLEYGINETYVMIGYHSIPVIADAIMQDKKGFDYELAFTAMKASAMNDREGVGYLKKMGYIPSDLDSNSVSKVLEYAYDDWCIAAVARKLNKEKDYSYFIKRAGYYKNVFDPSTRFMRGRLADGSWRSPFHPAHTTMLWRGDFTEANSWQYSFYVPQDIGGLIGLMGGDTAFCAKLDSLFVAKPCETDVLGVDDVTGLIGQYAHGNEPSHHTAYLYNYAGQPWKTQARVTEIKNTLYDTSRAGLCGNDDCGQMSAWYVFSALGFYPVTPGMSYYAIGSPSFKNAILHLPGGPVFTIKASNRPGDHLYIHSATLNGNSYSKSILKIADIQKGGILEFNMSNTAQDQLGTGTSLAPVSATDGQLIINR